MTIQDVVVEARTDAYAPVRAVTNRGDVECRYYPAEEARKAALWVPGAIGGWHSPAHDLYVRLCHEFGEEGIASLQVRYRDPHRLEESALDVLAGVAFLESRGAEAIALVGHSFGGAVAIQAAAAAPAVRCVVTLATQSYGTETVGQLGERCPILLIHGTDDPILPPGSSEHVYEMAQEPRRLLIYEGAGHNLDEVAEPVYLAVRDWITLWLNTALSGAPASAGE